MTGENQVDGKVQGQVVQAGSIQGGVHLHGLAQVVPVPRQLPAAPFVCVGRERELRLLASAMDEASAKGGAVVVSALSGAGGIGKTWLALYWAHQNVDKFPDGQLFVDLRGRDASGEPMSVNTAVRGFIDAFGIAADRIPVDVGAQVGLYRSLVADRRMLILLDNARDTTHAAQLLPGSPSCVVVVTSRDRLAGLVRSHGARSVTLDLLSDGEAYELLSTLIGRQRVEAEPQAASGLIACCAGLPLALSIVASRATAHPSFPLAALVEELELTRLAALDDGDGAVSLTAVLSWSYAALSVQEAMVFRMLGVAGSADVSLGAVAAMAQLPAAEAARVLRALERVSLVHEHIPGRYRMHDLVLLYAEDLARQDEQRQEAVRRLVSFYLHTAHNGDVLLDPDGQAVSLAPPRCEPLTFGSQADALEWFDIEHQNVLAAQQVAEGDAVWQLAWALHAYHWWRGHLHDDLKAWRTAAPAANDLSARVLVHQMLGFSYSRLRQYAEAFDQLDRALALTAELGDPHRQGPVHHATARAAGEQGDFDRALHHAVEALQCYRQAGLPMREAWALIMVGTFAGKLGDHELAHSSADKALALFEKHEYAPGKAAALGALGTLLASIGDYGCAMAYHETALTIRRELGNSYGEADTLAQLGATYGAMGRVAWSRSCWSAALALYRSQNRVADVEKALRELDLLEGR
ncbi:ATP-binding protein [Lentzea guizhouensis]|uniref:ATP-binding protein n=1 Tax=Lentzea guizhouensis TaxID=1586287 RepID=UPI0009F651A0|nr:tetratricopeptide repeat protein [Lentzea guizhouensis]